MSPQSAASKVTQVVVCLPLCRGHTDVTSVTPGLTGKLTPLYLVSHRTQLLPRPGLKYHRHPPCPAIFGNVLLGTPACGLTSGKPITAFQPVLMVNVSRHLNSRCQVFTSEPPLPSLEGAAQLSWHRYLPPATGPARKSELGR